MKTNFIRSVFLIFFAAVAALFALVPGGHCEEPCFDCLVRATDEAADVNPANRSLIGDIIACRPAGWAWGKKETGPDYRVVRICGIDSQGAELLCAPLTGPDGLVTSPRRFAVNLSDAAVAGGSEISADADAVIKDRSTGDEISASAAAEIIMADMAAKALNEKSTGGAQ